MDHSTGGALAEVSRAARGRRAAPLGINARFSTGLVLSPRVRRFMLQAGARELLPEERVAVCLRQPVGGAVSVLYSPKYRVGHLGGLQTCGSVWACPVCSAKISERRAVELDTGTRAWLARGGVLLLVSLTLQHSRDDALLVRGEVKQLASGREQKEPDKGLLGDLMQASYLLRTGDWWTRFQKRHALAGSVRSLEVTHGAAGWHPHLHMLCFVEAGTDVEAFGSELRARWGAVVAKVGRYASPRWGLDVRSANEEIAAYVAKFGKEQFWTVGRELAKSSSKNAYGSGRSMLELLELYVVAGDVAAGRLWREYALAFKSRHQHVWSRGLRALLGLIVEEKTDEEVAAEAIEDAVELARLDLSAWRIVLAHDARGELCEVASSGDPALVRSFLGSLGIRFEEVQDEGSSSG